MKKTKDLEPKKLNDGPKGKTYKILHQIKPGKWQTKTVTADEIAYGRVGIRLDQVSKRVVLEHIATGFRIADFPDRLQAKFALREMLQVTDFRWISPPREIIADIRDVIARYE